MLIRTLMAAATVAALTATAAPADEMHIGDLTVTGAWTRATAPSMRNGGAFLTIRNAGSADDRLVGASTPAAARTELHTHRMEAGVMKMRPVEGGIPVPAGGTAELRPGGYHVMMMGLQAPLAEGSAIALTLTFEKAGSVTLDVPVLAAGAQGGTGQRHGFGTDHGDTDMKGEAMGGDGAMKKMAPMDPPRDPAPHGSPMITPGGHVVQPR